jgi:hypothetical protein
VALCTSSHRFDASSASRARIYFAALDNRASLSLFWPPERNANRQYRFRSNPCNSLSDFCPSVKDNCPPRSELPAARSAAHLCRSLSQILVGPYPRHQSLASLPSFQMVSEQDDMPSHPPDRSSFGPILWPLRMKCNDSRCPSWCRRSLRAVKV